jgi:hypothetical protein
MDWCRRELGSGIETVLWETGHLSWVGAVRLDDGREVVLKARPPAPSHLGCYAVHRLVWLSGFPCPEPLTPPVPIKNEVVVSAEIYVSGGRPGRADDAWLCERTASALADLVARCPPVDAVPSLDPPRPWAGWSDPRADPWPPPDEGPPLNDLAETAELRPLAAALNERLRASPLPPVIGHVDWYQGNLRWAGGRLVAADDWDSVAALPEAALAGCSAVSFLPGRAGIDDTEAFLDAYALARARPFSDDEIEVAWAAGLWQRVFDAAKFLAVGRVEDARAELRFAELRVRSAGL